MSQGLRSSVAWLALALGCAHARTAANPEGEARAAEQAEQEARGEGASGEAEGDTKGGDAQGGVSEREASQSGAASAGRDGAERSEGEGAPRGEAKSERKDEKRDGEKKDDEKKDEAVDPEDIEVATTPEGLLEPGALDKVRAKLGLERGKGSLRSALQRFQREQGLPATGMLDHVTVERLGLSPDEIFEP